MKSILDLDFGFGIGLGRVNHSTRLDISFTSGCTCFSTVLVMLYTLGLEILKIMTEYHQTFLGDSSSVRLANLVLSEAVVMKILV